MQIEYDKMVDVYAYGVTLYEILTHTQPWASIVDDVDQIYAQVSEGQRPEVAPKIQATAPEGWVALMKRCWHQDQSERPTFKVILKYLEQLQSLVGKPPRSASSSY